MTAKELIAKLQQVSPDNLVVVETSKQFYPVDGATVWTEKNLTVLHVDDKFYSKGWPKTVQ